MSSWPMAVSRLHEARTYTSPSVRLARIRALKWMNTQWNLTRTHLFQSYRLLCIHVFSVVACYIWRNSRGLTAELPFIRATRSWFSCGFLKPPKWTSPKCLMQIQILHILYPRYSTNSKPWGCSECLRLLLLLDVWRLLRSSQSDLPNPLNHALRNPYRLGFNHSEKYAAPSHSFLDLSFGRFNMHLRLKSEASFRLQCSMQSILPAINKYAHVRSLTFLGLQWIEFESFKGCNFLKEQIWKSSQLQFQGTNFTWFSTKNPLTLGQKQLTAEENQSQISKCLQSRAPVQQQHAVALAADMK